MGATAERAEHASCRPVIDRLAQNRAVEGHSGVGGHDNFCWRCVNSLGLPACDPVDIHLGLLAEPNRLIDVRDPNCVNETELVEIVATAR
jgi:hypothetical protein